MLQGGGWVPVGSPVFKTGGGSRCGPRWVRLPSTPACITDCIDKMIIETIARLSLITKPGKKSRQPEIGWEQPFRNRVPDSL